MITNAADYRIEMDKKYLNDIDFIKWIIFRKSKVLLLYSSKTVIENNTVPLLSDISITLMSKY